MVDSYGPRRFFLGFGLAFGHDLIVAIHIPSTDLLLPPVIKIFSV
jgi:hypothetical protein